MSASNQEIAFYLFNENEFPYLSCKSMLMDVRGSSFSQDCERHERYIVCAELRESVEHMLLLRSWNLTKYLKEAKKGNKSQPQALCNQKLID